jgi:hypothetical protein
MTARFPETAEPPGQNGPDFQHTPRSTRPSGFCNPIPSCPALSFPPVEGRQRDEKEDDHQRQQPIPGIAAQPSVFKNARQI